MGGGGYVPDHHPHPILFSQFHVFSIKKQGKQGNSVTQNLPPTGRNVGYSIKREENMKWERIVFLKKNGPPEILFVLKTLKIA